MATSTLGARLSAPLEPARTWWWRRQRKVSPYLFIAPFFLLFLVFGLYPIIYSFFLSFTKGFGFENRTFVGLGNYIHLMSDPRFLMALRNTTIYALGSVVLIGGLSLLIALAINSKSVRWKTFYRSVLLPGADVRGRHHRHRRPHPATSSSACSTPHSAGSGSARSPG